MKKSLRQEGEAGAWWREAAGGNGAEAAVIASDGAVQHTFASMDQKAAEFARSFGSELARAAGDSSPPVCSLDVPPRADWPAAVLALWQCGAVVLLLPSVSAAQRDGIEEVAGATWRLEVTLAGNWHLRPLERPKMSLPWPAALLKVTSGSTGTPRLIGFTLRQLRTDAAQILQAMGISRSDRNFGVLPFSHSYGFSNLVTPLLFFGVPLVFAPDPLPRAIAHSLAASEATVWPAVPAMFSPLLEAGFSGTPHLRTVISAGAPLSSALARRWHEQTGLPIRSFYGSSECGGICYDGGGRAGEIEGWVGHPMPAVHLQKATRVNEAFTIEITGDAVGQGCLPCHSGDSLQNGKFRPADLLEAVEDGFRLVGRMDDLVNLGGRKVHPSEVEAVLAGLPGVRAVVVCGVEGRGGEELLAVVEGSPELSPADLREQTAASLPAWQVPRHWQIVARLPYNERGKISRRELAKLWSGNRLEPHRRNRKLPARGT